MANLIKQGEAKVVTKNGEVFVNISLELNIKLDGSNLQFGVAGQAPVAGAKLASGDEKAPWLIPDFGSDKIDFGK